MQIRTATPDDVSLIFWFIQQKSEFERSIGAFSLAWNANARNTRGLRFYDCLGAELTEQHGHQCLFRWVPWAAA